MKTVAFDLTDELYDKLEEIRLAKGFATKAQVLRNAVILYSVVHDNQDEGEELAIVQAGQSVVQTIKV